MIMSSDDSLSSLHTRPSLLFRLRHWSDETSWAEFYRLYYNFVFRFARRHGLKPADAEDVAQDVFKRVAETIHQFESDPNRGTFRGWLLNLTRWRIADKFRAAEPHERAVAPARPADFADRTATIERVPDEVLSANSETVWEEEWQRQVLDAALNRLAQRVPARHFQVFDLYSKRDWPVLRIARELGISIATVYVINHRLTKQLKAEVAQLNLQIN
jgi:RNA polymerase sigma-70 factor (ECF subfamily)